LKPYRYRRPVIREVSAPAPPAGRRCRGGRLIVYLDYNSTQAGTLDLRTGAFKPGGQD
jgi:hypothetical protein